MAKSTQGDSHDKREARRDLSWDLADARIADCLYLLVVLCYVHRGKYWACVSRARTPTGGGSRDGGEPLSERPGYEILLVDGTGSIFDFAVCDNGTVRRDRDGIAVIG